MVFKLTFRDRMIISVFLKFPCLECTWIHLKPFTFTFFKFHLSRLLTILIKHWHWQHIEMSDRYVRISWRENFTVFWNNRRLIGSCLYSLVLARGLFLKRFPPLVATHSAVVLKTALVKLWDPIKCPAFHLDEPIWNIWNILLGSNLEYENKQIFCRGSNSEYVNKQIFRWDPIWNMWTNKYFVRIQFGIWKKNIWLGSNLEYVKKQIFRWDSREKMCLKWYWLLIGPSKAESYQEHWLNEKS